MFTQGCMEARVKGVTSGVVFISLVVGCSLPGCGNWLDEVECFLPRDTASLLDVIALTCARCLSPTPGVPWGCVSSPFSDATDFGDGFKVSICTKFVGTCAITTLTFPTESPMRPPDVQAFTKKTESRNPMSKSPKAWKTDRSQRHSNHFLE